MSMSKYATKEDMIKDQWAEAFDAFQFPSAADTVSLTTFIAMLLAAYGLDRENVVDIVVVLPDAVDSIRDDFNNTIAEAAQENK